jgi:transposase-like protein
MTLFLLGNTLLRTAITRNMVSFPSHVRPFMKRSSGDLQARIVQLYFVRGWTVKSICARYNLSKAMAHKLLAEWRIRAIESGYIQEIEPGILDGLIHESNSVTAASTLDAGNVLPAPAAHASPEFIYANSITGAARASDNQAVLAAGSV